MENGFKPKKRMFKAKNFGMWSEKQQPNSIKHENV